MRCKNNEAPYYTLFIQFYAASKHLPQHPVLEHSRPEFFRLYETKFRTHVNESYHQGLYVWRITANVLNKKSRTIDKGLLQLGVSPWG